jgi:4-aminobutyrate aminotransferase-like enzyme
MTLLGAPRVSDESATAIALVERYAAHNYSPLPVVAASAEGAWITDVDGWRYLDFLSAYSAVNFGHRNPEITATARGHQTIFRSGNRGTALTHPRCARRREGSPAHPECWRDGVDE